MRTQTETGTRMPAENKTLYNPREYVTEEMQQPGEYRHLLGPILYRMQLAEEQRQRELELIDSTEQR